MSEIFATDEVAFKGSVLPQGPKTKENKKRQIMASHEFDFTTAFRPENISSLKTLLEGKGCLGRANLYGTYSSIYAGACVFIATNHLPALPDYKYKDKLQTMCGNQF